MKDTDIRPCGSCLTAEFADDDAEDDETLTVRPDSTVGHLRRPSGSWGTGDGLAILIRSTRKNRTYCGRPIGDDWTQVLRDTEGAAR